MPPHRDPVARKPKRRRRVAPAPIPDVQGGRGYEPAKPKRVAPSKSPVFGSLGRADAPIERARTVARRKVQRAQRALPERPLPSTPVLAHPTHAQDLETERLFRRSVDRQVPAGTPNRGAELARVRDELTQDPRSAQKVKRVQAAAERQANALALAVLDQHGIEGGTRKERVQAGRVLLAALPNAEIKPGQPDNTIGFGPATINTTALARAIATHTSLDVGDLGPRQFFGAAAGDVKTLGTAPFVGGFELGASAWEAAHGDTRRAKRLAVGIGKSLADSTPGQLVRGHPGAALEEFRRHPLLESVNLAGAAGAVGRGLGAVTRGAGSNVAAGGVRGALARTGSTVRPPVGLVDDAGTVALLERTHSKDVGRKRIQVSQDARRQPLRDPKGNIVTVVDRGRRVPVLKASPRERARLLRRRGNFVAARANSVERLERDRAHQTEARTMSGRRRPGGKPSKAVRDLVTMIHEGTVRSPETLVADLHTHRMRLLAEQERGAFRHSGELQSNQARIALIDRAIKNHKKLEAQAPRLFAAANRGALALNAKEAEAIRLGVLDPKAARRAKLIPWAIEHMGARHFTVDEHARLEKAARETEAAALAHARTLPAGPERQAATATWRSARADRIAVSGRHGTQVLQHEEAQAALKAARIRARLTKDQPIEPRGGGGGVPTSLKAARDALRQAEERARAAKLPPIREGARGPDGRFLSNDAIEASIREHRGADGLDTIAYLPHRLDVRGARAAHTQLRPGTRPVLDKETRTGEAYRRGSTEAGRQVVVDELSHKATQIAKARQLDRLIQTHGMRHPAIAKRARGETLTKAERRIVARGGGFNVHEADEVAQRLEHDTGERWVPIRAYGARLPAETQRAIRESMQNPAAMESLNKRLLNDRIVRPGDHFSPSARNDPGARNVVLVPEVLVNQLGKHLRPAGEIRRFLQFMNRPFRLAVLPQPRWLTGNFVEPYFVRLAVAGKGVVNIPGLGVDIAAAVKVVRRMERSTDPKVRAAALEVRAQQMGGLFIGGRGASVRRTAEDLPGVLKTGAVVRHLPVVKQLGDLAGGLLNGYFRANRIIEGVAQRASLGKSVREDIQSFTGSYLQTIRLGQQAVDEAARGLVGTATQERFMRAQHELLGQYEGYPPWLRELIQGPMPFLPFALSSARFVYWTMPAHRSGTTALLLATEKTFDQEWQDQHAPGTVPPGGLRDAIPRTDGGWLDLARYTPYGITVPAGEGDLQGITDQALPQLQGVAAAIQGQDPFGRPLKVQPTPGNPKGEPGVGDKALIGLNQLLEATVPYLSMGRRLQEHGETAYGDSTIVAPRTKPGTAYGRTAPGRVFNPLEPVYLKPPTSRGSRGAIPTQIQRELSAAGRELKQRSSQNVSPQMQRELEAAAQELQRRR